MTPQQLKQIPSTLAAILQGIRLYPGEHPQVRRQLENALMALRPLLLQQGRVVLGLLDDTLLVDDLPCLDQQPAIEDLRQLLETHRLQAVEFLPGLDSAQLLSFCQQLSDSSLTDLAEQLSVSGVTAIRLTLQDEEEDSAQAIYRQALKVVESVYQDVRLGRPPSSKEAKETAKGMVKTALTEPYALFAMAMLKDYDNYTFTHSVNVSVIALTVGRACNVGEEELQILSLGGMLHDLGKMTIDHGIITKPGQLNAEEVQQMKLHPTKGVEIVARMDEIPPAVFDIVNGHHLRYDRTGYPADSRGRALSPLADMVSIADTYDAMTTVRCYQRPLSPRQAIARMRSLSGSTLHPEFLEKFIAFLGPYPVGTLVRTRDGAIGLVVDQNRDGSGSLRLRQIFDPAGQRIDPPQSRPLRDSSEIVAEVDPLLKGIRVADYLDG